MKHHYISVDTSGDHWAVGSSAVSFNPAVLVQLQEKGEQARAAMSPEHAEYMAQELVRHAALVRAAKPLDESDFVRDSAIDADAKQIAAGPANKLVQELDPISLRAELSDGLRLSLKRVALAHVATNKKLIVLNSDYSFNHFVQALGGEARTLAAEEYGIEEFVKVAASLKPAGVRSNFFQHMLEFARPLDFAYGELDRVLQALHVDADTLIILLDAPELSRSEFLAGRFCEFILSAHGKGAKVVVER